MIAFWQQSAILKRVELTTAFWCFFLQQSDKEKAELEETVKKLTAALEAMRQRVQGRLNVHEYFASSVFIYTCKSIFEKTPFIITASCLL